MYFNTQSKKLEFILYNLQNVHEYRFFYSTGLRQSQLHVSMPGKNMHYQPTILGSVTLCLNDSLEKIRVGFLLEFFIG